jgi:anti-anti-sigma regulatory factor
VTVVRSDGPLFYANAVSVKEYVLATARADGARAVVIDISGSTDLDVETVDALTELADALAADRVDLRLSGVRRPAAGMPSRSGLAERVTIEPTVDAAVHHPPG